MSAGPHWTKKEDVILLRRMVGLEGKALKKRATRLVREGILPGRSAKGILRRYRRLRAREKPKTLGDDKRPLMKLMSLLDRARGNPEAWDSIFPKALATVESVYADIEAARAELEKAATAVRAMEALHKKQMSEEAEKLTAEMEALDMAIEREKLIDREVKQRD